MLFFLFNSYFFLHIFAGAYVCKILCYVREENEKIKVQGKNNDVKSEGKRGKDENTMLVAGMKV